MNSPPAINDIDRIIYDAVLWQTNLLQNVNHNVSSIHEIASVEINGERISRTLAFARHLRQKRDCRFLRFLGRKHFLPLTSRIRTRMPKTAFRVSTGLLKVHLIFLSLTSTIPSNGAIKTLLIFTLMLFSFVCDAVASETASS